MDLTAYASTTDVSIALYRSAAGRNASKAAACVSITMMILRIMSQPIPLSVHSCRNGTPIILHQPPLRFR